MGHTHHYSNPRPQSGQQTKSPFLVFDCKYSAYVRYAAWWGRTQRMMRMQKRYSKDAIQCSYVMAFWFVWHCLTSSNYFMSLHTQTSHKPYWSLSLLSCNLNFVFMIAWCMSWIFCLSNSIQSMPNSQYIGNRHNDIAYVDVNWTVKKKSKSGIDLSAATHFFARRTCQTKPNMASN